MKLALSAAAKSREFSRCFQRARKLLSTLIEQFSSVEMVSPIHESILVGLSDSLPADYFEEVQNRDGFFQVLAGVDVPITQEALVCHMLFIVERAVRRCPFASPDRQAFLQLLEEWREINAVGAGGGAGGEGRH
jgi:hypothetical protein